jgi:signal transduction histidine kinase
LTLSFRKRAGGGQVLQHLRFKTSTREQLIRSTFASRAALSIIGWVFALLLHSFSGRIPFLGRMVEVEVRIWAASVVLLVEGLLFVPYYWLRRRYPRRERVIHTVTATVDVLMGTLYIYSIGGVSFGAAAMFYSLIIVFAASVLTLPQTRYVISLCILLYTGLFYLEWNGILSAGSDPGPGMAGEYVGLYFLEGFGMLIFGVVAYQIARDYRGRERLMEVGSFVLGLSHELKTPLATVLHGVMRLKPGTVVTEEDVDVVRRNVRRVNGLVNSVLDYGSTGKVPLRPVPAAEAVRLGVEMAWGALREKYPCVRIELDTDPGRDTVLMADKEWLAQALANIVKNAVEASGEDGLITVSLAPGDALWAAIEVRDRGPGMSGEIMSRIFEPFFTTKGSGTGYGLGLPVARRIVEAHGGNITVESEPGLGTVFTVRIPLGDGLEEWAWDGSGSSSEPTFESGGPECPEPGSQEGVTGGY